MGDPGITFKWYTFLRWAIPTESHKYDDVQAEYRRVSRARILVDLLCKLASARA